MTDIDIHDQIQEQVEDQTREEAEAWLALQPEPPRQVFITIAGECHLVAYHHRILLRAIYPVSLARKPGRESMGIPEEPPGS